MGDSLKRPSTIASATSALASSSTAWTGLTTGARPLSSRRLPLLGGPLPSGLGTPLWVGPFWATADQRKSQSLHKPRCWEAMHTESHLHQSGKSSALPVQIGRGCCHSQRDEAVSSALSQPVAMWHTPASLLNLAVLSKAFRCILVWKRQRLSFGDDMSST